MQETRVFVCQNCGGILKWNIAKQQFACSSCHAPATVEVLQDRVVEHNLCNYSARDEQEIQFPDKTMVTCAACGAYMVFERYDTAMLCPMCGSAQVAEEKQQAGVPPDAIIPFRIDKERAQSNFRQWVKTRWFAPNRLKETFQQGKLEGLYIPFWTFDADARGDYQGEGGTEYESTNLKGKTITMVRWQNVGGFVTNRYDDIPVCASLGQESEVAMEILPYSTSGGSRPYSSAYLSGFGARRYAVRADAAVYEAKNKIEADLHERAERDIQIKGYDRARINHLSVDYQQLRYKHVLLPAWVSAFSYSGKTYLYMINGETGKVGGRRPYSIPKIIAASIAALLLAIGLLAILTTDTDALTPTQANTFIAKTSDATAASAAPEPLQLPVPEETEQQGGNF